MSRVRAVTNLASTSTGTFPSTSTGNLTNGLDLYQVCGSVTANVSHGSTKDISWRMQGSLHGTHWTNLNAAATTSTSTGGASLPATAAVNSTVAGLYNKVRIVVTANATTGDITTKWVVAGKP
jgi:hypothetical protein